ncbi:MAG: glycosyltransferase, partial [Caulobacteraceae bacterium]
MAIFRLDPAGGLEQHCLRLAAILRDRGCAVTLATTRPPAVRPEGMEVLTLPRRGRSNHGRIAAFAGDAARALARGRFDRTVVFHAVPGFEVVFCADPSRASPARARRWLPRYRAFARLERAAFAEDGAKLALMLSSAQLQAFERAHRPAEGRLALLPPTVDRRRAD